MVETATRKAFKDTYRYVLVGRLARTRMIDLGHELRFLISYSRYECFEINIFPQSNSRKTSFAGRDSGCRYVG